MTRRNQWVCASIRVGRGNLNIDLELSEPEPWMVEGLCAQVDPEAWYPEKGGSTRDAKRICEDCPVRAECLNYALAHDERFGIWGGKSERERRKLKAPRPLTTKDDEVLRLAGLHWTTAAIALAIGMTERTVLRVLALAEKRAAA